MDRETDPSLGAVLTTLRVIRAWNQRQLADAAGVSGATISRYEEGSRSVPTARLAVPDGREAPFGGVEPAEAAADARLEPGERQPRLALAAEEVQRPRPPEKVERFPDEGGVAQNPDERVASGELASRLPHRVDQVERALGQAGALGGVVMADDESEPLEGPALLVAGAIGPADGGGVAQR